MTKFLAALLAAVLAGGATLVFADDIESESKALSRMDAREAEAAQVAARSKWNSMTTEQRDAAMKIARAKKPEDATALDVIANRMRLIASPVTGDFWTPNDPMGAISPVQAERLRKQSGENGKK